MLGTHHLPVAPVRPVHDPEPRPPLPVRGGGEVELPRAPPLEQSGGPARRQRGGRLDTENRQGRRLLPVLIDLHLTFILASFFISCMSWEKK